MSIFFDYDIEYNNSDKKSDGYNVVNGKKKLDVGTLAILKGGRGITAKKPLELRWPKTGTSETIPSPLNSKTLFWL